MEPIFSGILLNSSAPIPFANPGGLGLSGPLGVVGCTDRFANNFNPNATIDDGSCIYQDTVDNDPRNGGPDGQPSPLIPEGRLRVVYNSTPSGAAIYVDNKDTGLFAKNIQIFDYKELLTQREIKAVKTGFTTSTRYRIKSDVQYNIAGLPVVVYDILKQDANGFYKSFQKIQSSGIESIITLPFVFAENPADDFDPNGDTGLGLPIPSDDNTNTGGPVNTGGTGLPIPLIHTINVKSDMSADGLIKYITSDGQSGFLQKSTTARIQINSGANLTYQELQNIDITTVPKPWIEFQKVGINNITHNTVYEIIPGGSSTSSKTNDDFRKELPVIGSSQINVTVNKLTSVPSPTTPIIKVDSTNYKYNLNSNEVLNIPYTTAGSDKVSYTLGSTKRDLSANGSVRLTSADFQNGLGNYTIILQPISNTNGSGEYVQIKINVVSETFREGPDITNINYPFNIKGADFKGYDENFNISWQSINTSYIEIYAGARGQQNSIAKVGAAGSLTLNVQNVLKKANKTVSETTGDVAFELILIPFNTEGSSTLEGKEEKIKIVFDKSDIKLKREQVIYDILSAFKKSCSTDIFKQYTNDYLTHYAHFGEGDNKLIVTWASDAETFSEYEVQDDNTLKKVKEEKAAVFKLYEPLPTSIQPNQQLWISKIKSLTLFEQTTITDTQVIDCIPLYPNLSLNLGDDIGFQILDDLVASGSQTSAQLIDEYINKNEFSTAKLNIEYITGSEYYWENFVKYSSAEERIENFLYKVKAIEFWEGKISALDDAASNTPTIQNEKTRISGSITNLKKGFDAFEQFLYTESSSLSYPGAGGNALSSSTDSSVTNWYNSAIYSAQNFDKNNQDAILNNIPTHFNQDSNNNDYMLFLNMMGNHFDVIWSYINGLRDSKKIIHTNKGGMISDLLYHMLESFGWDEKDMGIDSQPLWEYVFGLSKDGTQISSMTGKERQHEVWRRLLNNLPYIYKHKGTRRSLQAIMACYGIPSSMLTIMEFGGPSDPTVPEVIDVPKKTKFTYDDRTAAATFDGYATIKVPWSGSSAHDHPACIEMRVNTEKVKEHTLISGSGLLVKIIPESLRGKPKARLYMESNGYSGSTDPIPFYNDLYTNVAITREVSGSNWVFNLYMKEALNERIRNKSKGQVIIPLSDTTWANGHDELYIAKGFEGTVDEFRLWKTALSESRIENHTFLPDAIDGNHISASTEDLLLRFDFEYPKNLAASTAYLPNVALKQTYYTSASVSNNTILNFTDASTYPYQYVPYERIVTATVPSMGMGFSNKVRFETTGSDTYLSYNSVTNATNLERTQDSNRLGLFFSPMKEINMDIIRSLGDFSLDDFIGNPADYYNDRYTELDSLRKYYFSRYNLNIYEYIQLFRYLNKALFATLETLVAGRASVSSGLLIEPHLLERNKIKRKRPTAENIGEEVTLPVDMILLSHQMDNYLSNVDASTDILLQGESLSYTGVVSASDSAVLQGFYNTFDGKINTEDEYNISAEHKTYETIINAQYTGSIVAEYAGSVFTAIGMDPNGIARAGFGIYAENGHTIRTYLNKFGDIVRDRKQVYLIKDSRVVYVPENINPSDPNEGTNLVPTTFYDYKVTFLDVGSTAPSVSGSIVEVTPINGYLPSHYRYVGDLPTGLQNSWTDGSKQTAATTLDGGAPVQIFATNPNTLLVNQTGRGSGEPILYVD